MRLVSNILSTETNIAVMRSDELRVKKQPINYLLSDRFVTTQAAPLGATRTDEPGPGSWNIVDANNIVSINNGQLVINGTAAASSGIVTPAPFNRVCGQFLSFDVTKLGNATARIAFHSGSGVTAFMDYGYLSSGNVSGYTRIPGGTQIVPFSFTSLARLALITRNTGCFYVVRLDNGPWKLLWVDNNGSSSEYFKIITDAGTANAAYSNVQSFYLTGQWTSDFGIAVTNINNPAQSTPFVMPSDSLVVFSFIYATGGNFALNARWSDASNRWQISADSDGALRLYQIQAGVSTLRAAATGVFVDAANYRVVAVMDGPQYDIYVNNVRQISYTDPASFSINIQQFTLNGANTSVVAWPRYPILPAGI